MPEEVEQWVTGLRSAAAIVRNVARGANAAGYSDFGESCEATVRQLDALREWAPRLGEQLDQEAARALLQTIDPPSREEGVDPPSTEPWYADDSAGEPAA